MIRETRLRPPCDLQPFKRFFGLYRADESIKSMGEVVRDFARRAPKVIPPERTVPLPATRDEY